MNERGLVEVPENAVRDETLAFGLTAPQLGICGAAVGIAALLNLVPLWLPIKLVLLVVGVAPVVLAAILPIRGEPAYRWLVRAVRHVRGRRTWRAVLEPPPGKSQLSTSIRKCVNVRSAHAACATAVGCSPTRTRWRSSRVKRHSKGFATAL